MSLGDVDDRSDAAGDERSDAAGDERSLGGADDIGALVEAGGTVVESSELLLHALSDTIVSMTPAAVTTVVVRRFIVVLRLGKC